MCNNVKEKQLFGLTSNPINSTWKYPPAPVVPGVGSTG